MTDSLTTFWLYRRNERGEWEYAGTVRGERLAEDAIVVCPEDKLHVRMGDGPIEKVSFSPVAGLKFVKQQREG